MSTGPPQRGEAPAAPSPMTLEQGWARALRLMGQRAYAGAEVDARLRRAGCPADDRATILARLVRLKIVDDGRLAEQVAASEAARGRGRRAVHARLRRRGLDPAPAAAAGHEELALSRAGELLRRRFPDLDAPRQRARALRFLAGRGFDGQAAHALVARLRRPGSATSEPAG